MGLCLSRKFSLVQWREVERYQETGVLFSFFRSLGGKVGIKAVESSGEWSGRLQTRRGVCWCTKGRAEGRRRVGRGDLL